jgi:hypothetical protein
MKDEYNRRNFLKGIGAVAATTAAAGCSAPTSSESVSDEVLYETLEKGVYSEELGFQLEDLDTENQTASIHLAGGSTQSYEEGDLILCDKTGEKEVGSYLEDIDYKEKSIEVRKELGDVC